MLVSDGITECPDPAGQELGSEGLQTVMQHHAAQPSPQLLETLVWDLVRHAGTDEFPDDVSALIFDFRGGG